MPPISKLHNAGNAAYWAFKAFQAIRMCYGDPTVIAEIAAEFVGEGLVGGTVAYPEMVVTAIERVVNLHEGIDRFRRSVKNFSHFARALANQLVSRGNKADSSTMVTVDRIYSSFIECDRDRSGGVSLEEYIIFCSKEGVPSSMARTMFFQADVDGNGQISFEEWTAMIKGRVGRDPKSFNCGGHHGLTIYTAPCSGITCNFCLGPISEGSPAAGCRRCDCDACAACSGITCPPPPPHRYTEAPATSSPLRTAPGILNCRGRHGLAPFRVKSRVKCNWCQRHIAAGNVAVGCRMCDCDACIECAAVNLASNSTSLLTCPGRHGLALTRTAVPGYSCDFCKEKVPLNVPIFSCRPCQLDACLSCVWNDHTKLVNSGGAFSCRGNHQLKTIRIKIYSEIEAHKCSWCRGNPVLGACMLRCDICCINVCNVCVANNPAEEPLPL